MRDKYAYSIDEESYDGEFETMDAAIAEGFACHEDCDVLWIGKIVIPEIKQFVHAEKILEMIAEYTCEDHGEYAQEWFDSMRDHNEKHEELETIISEWINEHHPITFFSVEDVEMVTREDHVHEDKQGGTHEST